MHARTQVHPLLVPYAVSLLCFPSQLWVSCSFPPSPISFGIPPAPHNPRTSRSDTSSAWRRPKRGGIRCRLAGRIPAMSRRRTTTGRGGKAGGDRVGKEGEGVRQADRRAEGQTDKYRQTDEQRHREGHISTQPRKARQYNELALTLECDMANVLLPCHTYVQRWCRRWRGWDEHDAQTAVAL